MTESSVQSASLGDRIKEAMEIRTVFTVHVGDLQIPVTETVITTWIVMALLIVGALLLTRKLKQVPTGPQVFLESLVGFSNNFFKERLGHHWKTFSSYLGTVALFLAVANMISFISPLPGFGFTPPFMLKPPTRDINVTAALALMTIAIVLVSNVVAKGPIGWVKSFFKPVPFMLPFNLLEYVTKPLSLCLRLFGNILGAFIIMEIITIILPVFLPPIAGLYFDLFDGLIQAMVFVFLSTLYISEAVEN
jgi:F-type H+-transporting ATPase subunit a